MRARTSRLLRKKERLTAWLHLLPPTAQDDALAAIEDFAQSAEVEIEEAYGDGYRKHLDESRIAAHKESK